MVLLLIFLPSAHEMLIGVAISGGWRGEMDQ